MSHSIFTTWIHLGHIKENVSPQSSKFNKNLRQKWNNWNLFHLELICRGCHFFYFPISKSFSFWKHSIYWIYWTLYILKKWLSVFFDNSEEAAVVYYRVLAGTRWICRSQSEYHIFLYTKKVFGLKRKLYRISKMLKRFCSTFCFSVDIFLLF